MPDTPGRGSLPDRLGPEWLVHPLLQTARGYLTDEDYVAVEATLQEAVERAKDLEAENDRLRSSFGQAVNYLNVVRSCCGYTVPGAGFGVEREELEGAMRGIGAWVDALRPDEFALPADEAQAPADPCPFCGRTTCVGNECLENR